MIPVHVGLETCTMCILLQHKYGNFRRIFPVVLSGLLVVKLNWIVEPGFPTTMFKGVMEGVVIVEGLKFEMTLLVDTSLVVPVDDVKVAVFPVIGEAEGGFMKPFTDITATLRVATAAGETYKTMLAVVADIVQDVIESELVDY